MTTEDRQVLRPMPVWVGRLYMVLGLAYATLAVLSVVRDPGGVGWREWVNLLLALAWLLVARGVGLRVVLTSAGVSRERFLGGFARVPWTQVEHVGHDADTPAFRTGGEVRLASGRQLAFRGWSSDGVEQARAWWQAGRSRGRDQSRPGLAGQD